MSQNTKTTDIPRYDISLEKDWGWGPDGSFEYSYLEVLPREFGEWVRWDDVEELITKNERTEDTGEPATRQDELGKG
jgi:hypothetical protein